MDFVYSDHYSQFLTHAKQVTKNIIINELHLVAKNSRFIFDKRSIPFSIVLFERANVLGFFDAHGFRIGLHKKLCNIKSDEALSNIIRHELAHFIDYLENKNSDSPHSTRFREICKRYNWGEEVFLASQSVIEAEHVSDQSLILAKVKKLLSLSGSDNPHEASLALEKANRLLLEHNLDNLNSLTPDEDTFVRRVLFGKKISEKHRTICDVLDSFFVSPIFSYSKNGFYLEVIGTKSNIELADYVAAFLNHELDFLWEKHKKKAESKTGVVAKNSFMKGILRGYKERLKPHVNNTDLILIDKEIERRLHEVYPRLSMRYHHQSNCAESFLAGITQGKGLSINPAVKNSSGNTKLISS